MNMPAALAMGPGIGQPESGPALAEEFGASMGRGLGPGTNPDHDTRTGMALGGQDDRYRDPRWNVPGYPQDMMEMKEMMWASQVDQLKGRPGTQGMRHNWYIAPGAMMTVLRVLPDDLYEKVKAGRTDIPDGASIPGPDQG